MQHVEPCPLGSDRILGEQGLSLRAFFRTFELNWDGHRRIQPQRQAQAQGREGKAAHETWLTTAISHAYVTLPHVCSGRRAIHFLGPDKALARWVNGGTSGALAGTNAGGTGNTNTGGFTTGGTDSGGVGNTGNGGAPMGGTAFGGSGNSNTGGAGGAAGTGGKAGSSAGGVGGKGGSSNGGAGGKGGTGGKGGSATGGTAGATGGTGVGGIPNTCTEADRTLTGNGTGKHCGYTYEYWKDQGTGSLILKPDGFSASWSGINNLLGRKGIRPGSASLVATYTADFTPGGNSYLSMYGWTRNPLVEYYIVENYGTYKPPGTAVMGTVTTDGGTYDIYRAQRVNANSIDGVQTFYQYWSVRQTKRTSGTITLQNHITAWASHGMNMGSFYEVSMSLEGYQSSGSGTVHMVIR
jgi:endo-1,4-beta-xylanase